MGSGFSRKKKEAKQMQDQLSKMQTQMSKMEVAGTAGNGLVTLILSGEGALKSIKIQPDCVDKEDIEGLEMLIKSAHADAQKKITEQTASSAPSSQWLSSLQ